MRIARENARAEGLAVDFEQGNASHMPYPDQAFDFVVCRAAFKNFTDPLGALNEVYRVLVPGGRASIYDLRKEASRAEIETEVRHMGLSWVNTELTKWIFRTTLLKNAYTAADMERLVGESRLGGGYLRQDGMGFDLRLVRSLAR